MRCATRSSVVVIVVAILAPSVLTGCGSTIPLLPELGLPTIATPHMLRIEEAVDKPTNVIEHALSECDKFIETGEAACVKAALVDHHVSVAALTAMLRPCRQGEVCHYQYTTDDRVGLYAPTTARFVVHWRVDFDFTHPVGDVAAVPITVAEI